MSLFLQVGFCKDANLLIFFDYKYFGHTPPLQSCPVRTAQPSTSSINLKYRSPYAGHHCVRSSLYYASSRNAGFMPCGSGMRNVLSIIETRA
jgi:hypothetical protein